VAIRRLLGNIMTSAPRKDEQSLSANGSPCRI
jgi:hypothetical protein